MWTFTTTEAGAYQISVVKAATNGVSDLFFYLFTGAGCDSTQCLGYVEREFSNAEVQTITLPANTTHTLVVEPYSTFSTRGIYTVTITKLCDPACGANECGADDGCGGICGCAVGEQCNNDTHACEELAGDTCAVPLDLTATSDTTWTGAGTLVNADGRGYLGGYGEYKRASLHTISAGFRVPYELLTGDLSQVNYSSIRAGLVEFRRQIDAVQWQLFIPMFCAPVWRWFTEAAWAAGQIPSPIVPVEWSPPKFEAVDPQKDAMANLLSIRSGTMTLAEVIARQGRNPDAVLAEIAATNAKLDALGLVLDSDPRRVTKTGSAQSKDGASDPANDPAADEPDADDPTADADTDPAQADQQD